MSSGRGSSPAWWTCTTSEPSRSSSGGGVRYSVCPARRPRPCVSCHEPEWYIPPPLKLRRVGQLASNIEIAQAAKMKRITEIATARLGIEEENLEAYGRYKAKLSLEFIETLKNKPDGKLILVTAISPTPA